MVQIASKKTPVRICSHWLGLARISGKELIGETGYRRCNSSAFARLVRLCPPFWGVGGEAEVSEYRGAGVSAVGTESAAFRLRQGFGGQVAGMAATPYRNGRSAYARLCPLVPACARLCPLVPACARLCPLMPAYARLCPHICGRDGLDKLQAPKHRAHAFAEPTARQAREAPNRKLTYARNPRKTA